MSGILGPTKGLSTEEKRALAARLLREKATRGRASKPPVHRLVEAQAARSPGSVAVVSEGRTLTYDDLNTRADRLAERLRAVGVGPETLVGVFLERSVDLVVGLLAILKAGGAYLPLDPAFPGKRLALMVEDARLSILLTETGLVDSAPSGPDRLVLVEDDPVETAPSLPGRPGDAADRLAYVIYTSGSTGTPKGVAISHGALSNFVLAMGDLLGIGRDDTLLAVTTLSFDIAALEIFLPLVRGARLEIARRDVAADGLRLAARLDRGDVTFLQATPATWRMLLEAGWTGTPGLAILSGGEALARDLADRLAGKGKALWNLYGPTETTIWSSVSRLEPGDGPITIGRPIAETQFYLLDGRSRLVPSGVVGELYIGGSGLARGYLGRAGLTAERFVPDPFSPRPGARLYRTGDLARWRSDGSWECLGRVDQQVKIRGFRIELGEIESHLARHPTVARAVVAARVDRTGEQGLVAFVTPRDGARPDGGELRRWLRETLPEYMIPAGFGILEALPMTPNGKVDRKALPDLDPALAESGPDETPPRGPIEEAIVQFWGELLGRPRIGVLDNFFDIGGHSLLATQVLARVRDTFAVEPTLREFLDAPTAAGLALVVDRRMREGTGAVARPVGPIPRTGDLPASFAQQRLWFLDQLEPNSPIYNMPVAVRLAGDLDIDALSLSLNEVVRRHEALRTTFAAPDGIPRQVIGQPEPVLLDVNHLDESITSERREAEARRLMDLEARRPFDLARGPLIRAGLLRIGPQDHLILVTIHHIVSDAWSLGILIREVGAIYEAFAQGRPSPLPEPVLHYADYAAWQRDWLSGEVLQGQLDYWASHLGGVPVLELPTDRPRPAALSGRGAERELDLPMKLLDQVRSLGRQEGVTLYMTLMAAFQVLLHRYSGQDNFAIGSPIAGRTRTEVVGLIGFFVNTLVLRADLAGDPDFLTTLARVRRSALGAYAHQDLPFEKLVAVLHPERDPARSPLFQALFALQNAPLPALQTTGLTMKAVEPDNGTAKFDLALFAAETASGLNLTMQFSTDLFDPATVDQMLIHYRTLLEAIVADPGQPIAGLPMLSDSERHRLLDPGDSLDSSLDGLSDEEVEALLSELESGSDAQDQ